MLISELQNAIVDRLRSLGVFRSVSAISEASVRELGDVSLRTPCCFVAYAGARFDYTFGNSERNTEWQVYVVHRSYGPDAQTSVYDLLESVRQALFGYTASDEMTPLMPTAEEFVSAGEALVYAISFTCTTRP